MDNYEMVRGLVVACVERRFGTTKAAHPVERLSDNGSGHRTKDTLDTATALGLRLAFTSAHSPESNGIAEAFANTLKCDHARIALLPGAATILGLVPAWIKGHNPATRTIGNLTSQPPVRSDGVPSIRQDPHLFGA